MLGPPIPAIAAQGAEPPPGHHTYDGKWFFKDLLRDQKAIWTSPLALRPGDAKWLVPLVAATGGLIQVDRDASHKLVDRDDLIDTSKNISDLGGAPATFGAAAAIYGIGKWKNNGRATETGLLGLQALIHSGIVVNAIKVGTNRKRPNAGLGRGRFYNGGASFPSGHAIGAWALGTVIAEEYPDKPVVRFSAYGVATAVSVLRFTGREHFPSDTLVGSVLGYLIGRYVVHRHGSR
ncbi:MAG: phosphatase PAP2 family protein [Acidobacteriota bacterium]